MKSIHLLFVFSIVCVFIVPSLQYGTIFTDYLSTPVNFTDITETYISGIKSKTAHANTAAVETIEATNPDGFYVNSPGPLTASAGQTIDFTSAQVIAFGDENSVSTSLVSGGDLYIKNDRTDINTQNLTLSTGDTLYFSTYGPLTLQGSNIDIATEGNGNVLGRDIYVDSATYADVYADGDILLNSTHHSSFISPFGGIDVNADDITNFKSNFINLKSTLGVDIHSNFDVNIDAFAILEIQAAQFAQIHSVQDLNVNVLNGDFNVNAAATVAITSYQNLTFTAVNQFHILSLGDSSSVIQLNSQSGTFSLASKNSITLATFLDNNDVDIVSAGSIASHSENTNFFAENYVSFAAGNDISVLTTDTTVAFFSLDIDSTSVGDIAINSFLGDLTLLSSGIIEGEARDVFFATNKDIDITGSEVSFLQGSPAILTRSKDGDFNIHSKTISTSSVTTQFDTIGILSLSASSIDFGANTLSIRSSVGPHDVSFSSYSDTSVTATDNLRYRGSGIVMNPRAMYTTESATLNIESTGAFGNFMISDFDLVFNSPLTSLVSSATLSFESSVSTNFIMTDSYTHNSYNTDLICTGNITFQSAGKIAVGSEEYINVESTYSSYFDATSTFVHGTQTGSMFAESISANVVNGNFFAGDTLYFTSNLPTDSLLFSANSFTFNGDSVFESGNDIGIYASTTDFSGNSLFIEGFDSVTIITGDFNVYSSSSTTISSDSNLATDADGELTFNANFLASFIGQSHTDNKEQITSSNYFGSVIEYSDDAKNVLSYTATDTTFQSITGSIAGSQYVNISSEDKIQINAAQYTVDSAYTNFDSLKNIFNATGAMTFDATDANIDGNSNSFTSQSDFSSISDETWLLGENYYSNSSTVTMTADDQGYFYSDDQISFNVDAGITVSSDSLLFKIPLDGTLHLEGLDTTISSSAVDFDFQSEGSTNINSAGSLTYSSNENTVFDSYTAIFKTTDSFSLSATAANSIITFIAHDGVVDINAQSQLDFLATTNSFLASRDINIGETQISFTSYKSSPLTLEYNYYSEQSQSENVAILAETFNEDSHIVFDALAGKFATTANNNIYINAGTTQSYISSTAYDISTGRDIDFKVVGNQNINANTGTSYSSALDFNFLSQDFIHIESGKQIIFSENLAYNVDPATEIFSINAGGNILVSTAGNDGAVTVSSTQGMKYTTSSFQSFVVTQDAVTKSSSTAYTSTLSDIDFHTSDGIISVSFGTNTATANTNITFNSGHDSTFTGGDFTFTAGADYVTRSVDGEIIINSDVGATFTAVTGQLSIDSEGDRTVPRDGVFLGADVITMDTSGANSAISLYARRSVTFGQFTRPNLFFYGGGSPTQSGFTLNSDGGIRLTSEGSTNFAATGQTTITTSQAAILSSGKPLTIESTGTSGPPSNILISSLIGNVHLNSEKDSTWNTDSQFSATSTGSIQFTTLKSATFSGTNFKETANSIAYSLDLSYESDSTTSTLFDGHSYLTITTNAGSDASIRFTGDSNTFSSGSNFAINTIGNDAKEQFTATALLNIQTTKTGSVSFQSGDNFFSSSQDVSYTTSKSFLVSSQSALGQDPTSSGAIEFYSLGDVTLSAGDTIDTSANKDFSLIASASMMVTSTGTMLMNSDWDQQWLVGTTSSSAHLEFDGNTGITLENSPEAGGDISFNSYSLHDITSFSSQGDISLNVGNNEIGEISNGFRLLTTGSDYKNSFGIRFQTEGVNADLEIDSSASLSFSAYKNVKFDASQDLTVYGGIAISMVAQGTNYLDQGVIFVASNGDIDFTTDQSPIILLGNEIKVIGNGTTDGSGYVKLVANGIDKSSSYGISMAFNASVAAFASIFDNVNVVGSENIEINLNHLTAHAVFGWQRELYDELFTVFQSKYHPNFPYIPSKQIATPLKSRTKVISSGINADIVFETQEPQDGIGQFIAYAGAIEPPDIGELAAPSQLQLVAYGNGEETGDITFAQEGGITFRGFDRRLLEYIPIGNPTPQSNCLFLANDDFSSVVVSTTESAIFSNIKILTPELTMTAENKLQIRSIARNGDSNLLFDTGKEGSDILGKIAVSTTGASWGPGSALPGIELRAYRSAIQIDAGEGGDVVHHALRNMDIEADNGFYFESARSLSFFTGTVTLSSSEGGFTFNYQDVNLRSSSSIILTTLDNPNEFGNNVIVRSPIVSFTSTDNGLYTTAAGDIVFNFDNQASVNTQNTYVNGFLSIPMINYDIISGAPCTQPSNLNSRSIFIARSPPYDRTFYEGNVPYSVYLGDIYQGLGLRLCTCGNPYNNDNWVYECMSLSQFY